MSETELDVATDGQIWIPPRSHLKGLENAIHMTFYYGQVITINFENSSYFTASNLITFTPSLPTGSFPDRTTLGPYYAAAADGFVIFTAYDEETTDTYIYAITVIAPSAPPPE